jgi:hypothetical protein
MLMSGYTSVVCPPVQLATQHLPAARLLPLPAAPACLAQAALLHLLLGSQSRRLLTVAVLLFLRQPPAVPPPALHSGA